MLKNTRFSFSRRSLNCFEFDFFTNMFQVCLAYHTGMIAGNLHLDNPRTDVAGVCDGRIRLLDDHAAFQKGYTAVNSFTYAGTCAHFLLKNLNVHKVCSGFLLVIESCSYFWNNRFQRWNWNVHVNSFISIFARMLRFLCFSYVLWNQFMARHVKKRRELVSTIGKPSYFSLF